VHSAKHQRERKVGETIKEVKMHSGGRPAGAGINKILG